MSRFRAFMVLAVWGFGSALAGAATITFDEFPANNNNVAITTLYAPVGVIFGSDNSGTWGGNSRGNPGNWGLEGTNGPGFLGNNGLNNGNTYITSIFFVNDVVTASFDVSRSNGSSAGQTLTAQIFDDGVLQGTAFLALININAWGSIGVFSSGGFDTLILTGSNIGFSPYGVDNLQFAFAPVPEPTTVALLGAGFLGLAALRRRSA